MKFTFLKNKELSQQEMEKEIATVLTLDEKQQYQTYILYYTKQPDKKIYFHCHQITGRHNTTTYRYSLIWDSTTIYTRSTGSGCEPKRIHASPTR